MIEYPYYKRMFLNEEKYEQGAYIIAKLHKEKFGKSDDSFREASITISDCNRIIELTFDIENSEGRSNTLIKLKKLITTLQDFEKAILKEIPLIIEEDRLQKIKKKKDKKKRLDK